MAQHRIAPDVLQDDLDGFANLKTFLDYKPANEAYSIANGDTAKAALDDLQAAEVVAKRAFDAARDNAAAAEAAFHEYMLGVKKQVGAQYGDDSNEYQAVGLKKKSEYKKPGARASAA